MVFIYTHMIVIGINHEWTIGCVQLCGGQGKASELAVRLDETRTEVELDGASQP